MTAEVCLTPALINQFDLQGKNVVIIDIFRATSCMVTGLCNEVTAIYPVASVDECLAHGDQGRIMAGERGGQKLEAFDIGNSPYDYLSETVHGREVAVTTTNGTLAIDKSRSANEIIIAAFLNLSATRDYLLELDGDIVLHCAGWKGSVNLEDTLFAGALLEALGDHIEIVGDAAQMALSLFQHHKGDLIGVARSSGHAQRLAKFGIVKDIDFCMTFDKYEGVILMDGDRLVKRS